MTNVTWYHPNTICFVPLHLLGRLLSRRTPSGFLLSSGPLLVAPASRTKFNHTQHLCDWPVVNLITLVNQFMTEGHIWNKAKRKHSPCHLKLPFPFSSFSSAASFAEIRKKKDFIRRQCRTADVNCQEAMMTCRCLVCPLVNIHCSQKLKEHFFY